jgi:hypothetical protein
MDTVSGFPSVARQNAVACEISADTLALAQVSTISFVQLEESNDLILFRLDSELSASAAEHVG